MILLQPDVGQLHDDSSRVGAEHHAPGTGVHGAMPSPHGGTFRPYISSTVRLTRQRFPSVCLRLLRYPRCPMCTRCLAKATAMTYNGTHTGPLDPFGGVSLNGSPPLPPPPHPTDN